MNDLAVAGKLTPEQERACELALDGKSLKDIAAALGISTGQLAKWREQPVFDQALRVARETSIDVMIDETLDIRDENKFPDLKRGEAFIRAAQWAAGKRYRQVYGEKLDIDVHQTIDIVGALAEARARILRPMCDPAQIEYAEYTVESSACDARPRDKQSVSRLPEVEALPQPDVFS